jgi:hypothetical protein
MSRNRGSLWSDSGLAGSASDGQRQGHLIGLQTRGKELAAAALGERHTGPAWCVSVGLTELGQALPSLLVCLCRLGQRASVCSRHESLHRRDRYPSPPANPEPAASPSPELEVQ